LYQLESDAACRREVVAVMSHINLLSTQSSFPLWNHILGYKMPVWMIRKIIGKTKKENEANKKKIKKNQHKE
jgi:hypothetical protein